MKDCYSLIIELENLVFKYNLLFNFVFNPIWKEYSNLFKFNPLNRTIASEGASLKEFPGVTILGSGSQTSVSSGLIFWEFKISRYSKLVGYSSWWFKTKNGVFIFEEPYLGSVFKKTSYDQIYDEHIYLFSAIAIQKISKEMDLILQLQF